MNPKWLVIAIEMDFYKNIDKLLRDNFKYIQCCLQCLFETVTTICPQVVQRALAAFQNPSKSVSESAGIVSVIQGSMKEYSSLRGDNLLVLALHELVSTSSFK